MQLDFDLGVFTVRGSSHQLNCYCRLLRMSSNASENTLFTVISSSADELISLKVKIIEFGQKGCVAIGAAVLAILWMTIYNEIFAQTFVQLLSVTPDWSTGSFHIDLEVGCTQTVCNQSSMTLSTFTVEKMRSEEIRVDAIKSCPHAFIKYHNMMSLTSPAVYTNLTKKGTSLWYLLLRHSWQLCSNYWASEACGCPHSSKSRSALRQSVESSDFAPAVD